jgi:hypothetical protein
VKDLENLRKNRQDYLDGRRVCTELSMAKLDNASNQVQDQPIAALAAVA